MNAVLVAGVALWASFNLYIITPHHFNFGNLNPFEKTPSPTYSPRGENASVPKITLPAAPTMKQSNNETINPPVAEEKKAEEKIPVAAPKENVVEASGNYFVVAGVFKIPSNAENFLAKLKTDGYENSGSIERENKPTIIFVTRHQQKEDAVASMHELKGKGIDVWVLSK